MHTIAFYSYKGGVGRTLLVANVAKYLARMGKKVLVLDFDLEAPGLHYKFELEHGKPLTVTRGLVDILAEFSVSRRLPDNLADHVIEVAIPTLSSGEILLLPAGNAPSPEYWRKLSKVNWHMLFYADEAEGVPLFLELKAFADETYRPDFMLIDARTGITEMGGVATTVLSDRVVCLMLPTREHLEGTRGVMRALCTAPRLEGSGELGLVAVLSRVLPKNPREEQDEVWRVRDFLNAPGDGIASHLNIDDVLLLHRDAAIEEREHVLIGGNRGFDESSLLQDYVRLFVRLVPEREIEISIGRLIDDIQRIAFDAPDDAEKALEDLARHCLHPKAYRALIAMYRLRRSDVSKMVKTAYTLWRMTGDSGERLLWDAVKDYVYLEYLHGDSYGTSHEYLDAVEAVWRAHGAKDARLAVALSETFYDAGLRARAIGVLSALSSSGAPTGDSLAMLIRALCAEGRPDRAAEEVARFKEKMADSPDFVEAWVEMVLGEDSHDGVVAMLGDPHFDLNILHQKSPALAARLRLFEGARSEAAEVLKRAHLGRTRRAELVQLGALARELGDAGAFEARLSKVYSAGFSREIFVEIDRVRRMPGASRGDDIPF